MNGTCLLLLDLSNHLRIVFLEKKCVFVAVVVGSIKYEYGNLNINIIFFIEFLGFWQIHFNIIKLSFLGTYVYEPVK